MKGIDTIIWDWNGTLLNDVDICIDVINDLLSNRNHPQLTKERYHDIFTFPVKDYYTEAGFDFSSEPFDKIAIEFMDGYFENLKRANLFKDVVNVLKAFREMGFRQYMLSAMEHNALLNSVKGKGIFDYFQEISGIHDHFAKSKLDMAKNFMQEFAIDNNRCCLIGDTKHDYEVANELGVNCLLVANGHQSYKRLAAVTCPVVENLKTALACFQENQLEIIYNTNEESK